MKSRRFISLLLVLALLLSTPVFAAGEDGSGADSAMDLVQQILDGYKLDNLLDIIEDYSLYEYQGDDVVLRDAAVAFFANHPELFEEFANYLFATQDEYSHYMEPSTYDSSYVLDESFVGVGVQLDSLQDGLIVAIIPNSPAEEAGMKAGDMIISADGVKLDSTYYKAIQEKLRGEEGTSVTIGVLRDGEELEFTMTRRKIIISNIALTDLGGGVAYIRIAHFGDMQTFIDFVNTCSDLGEEGFTSVIFDVRDNGGGSLDTLLNILNYTFWDADEPMFSLRFRDSDPDTYYSLGAGWEPENIVVLTNSNTASAAEVFAGALGYCEGAWIVGENDFTYGKGVGQSHIELNDGSFAVITTLEIMIGEGIEYNGVGIPSDIVAPAEALVMKDDLLPLYSGVRMYQGATGTNVRALEQRLCLLGYTSTAPDGKLDAYELEALDLFRSTKGLKPLPYADRAAMEALDSAMSSAPDGVAYDSALSEAMGLCGLDVEQLE